jgi:MoxR-like ATPase
VLSPVVPAATIAEMTRMATTVHVDPSINDYVARIIDGTRQASEVRLGASVRGALSLIRSSKTLAAASGRSFVIPDDVKSLADTVLSHRLILDAEAEFDGVNPSNVIAQVLIDTPPPRDTAAA